MQTRIFPINNGVAVNGQPYRRLNHTEQTVAVEAIGAIEEVYNLTTYVRREVGLTEAARGDDLIQMRYRKRPRVLSDRRIKDLKDLPNIIGPHNLPADFFQVIYAVCLHDYSNPVFWVNYLGGDTVDRLKENTDLSIEQKVLVIESWYYQLSYLLEVLQNANVGHFDLKPTNLIYCIKTKLVKVIDPETAQKLNRHAELTNDITATPRYLAPEHAEAILTPCIESVDNTSFDTYAAALTLYNLIELVLADDLTQNKILCNMKRCLKNKNVEVSSNTNKVLELQLAINFRSRLPIWGSKLVAQLILIAKQKGISDDCASKLKVLLKGILKVLIARPERRLDSMIKHRSEHQVTWQ